MDNHEPAWWSYSPKENSWFSDNTQRVSQHDVVYQSPPDDPLRGMPIGNGDIGALLWIENGQLIVSINKNDIFDVNIERKLESWTYEKDENRTSPRSCGRLIIDFPMPVFDLIYQSDFNGRIDLAHGQASLQSKTPFSETKITAFFSHPDKVLVLQSNIKYGEKAGIDVQLERWGSRSFNRWYSDVTRDASLGLEGTESCSEDDTIIIYQKLRTMEFAVAARISTSSFETEQLHSRAACWRLPRAEEQTFTIYLTVVTGNNKSEVKASAIRILDEAQNKGTSVLYERHITDWSNFWHKSFINIPDKYIENIWYLNLYYAHSSLRGEYPPHFCNGLWSSQHDFTPWNYFFHWNMQWQYWFLHTSNHPELTQPYFKYRFKQLPAAVKTAENTHRKPGAFFGDVADARGFNEPDIMHNNTPGLQIAMDFWRHYRFTGDMQFLNEKAWPVIREVARFYTASLSMGDDGLYHMYNSQAYEGSPLFDDTITDISTLKAFLPIAIKAAAEVQQITSEIKKWEEIYAKLVDISLVKLEDNEFRPTENGAVLSGGIGEGERLNSLKVMAVGRYEGEEADRICATGTNLVRNRHAGVDGNLYYGIPDPEFSAVFPSGFIDLKDKGTEVFDAAVNQVLIHPKASHDEDAYAFANTISGVGKNCMGWCPYTVVLARLGLKKYLYQALRDYISTWQVFCQGFGIYGPYPVFSKDVSMRWKLNRPKCLETGESFPFPAWSFRHFDHEAMPIAGIAVNEMLLQSHTGVIRLAAALPEDWDCDFTLAAQGGFIVHAACRKGEPAWLCVESMNGECCKVIKPWKELFITSFDPAGGSSNVNAEEKLIGADTTIEFPTQAGYRYFIGPSEQMLQNWRIKPLLFKQNQEYKELDRAMLGLPRMF